MKYFIAPFFILISTVIYSQVEKTIINKVFNNNDNNWEISTSQDWHSSINDGNYNLSNSRPDKTSYFKPRNLHIKNKQGYYLETNIKFNLVENNTAAGIIFISDEEVNKETYSLLLGYLVMVVKYNDEYHLQLNKTDWTGFNYYIKLNNFDINKSHSLKIMIDNNTPKTSIVIDNQQVFEKKFPLFNFDNVGFYQMGKVSMVINDIIIKVSKSDNSMFMFDQTDMVYNQTKNMSNTIKGFQYTPELTKYVPKGILLDDYRNQFKQFKEEILIDENCENFKTIPADDGTTDVFVFTYKSNIFFTFVSKENTFLATSITFNKKGDATEFYNLYSKAKGFKIEAERSYFPMNEMKAILLNKAENKVTIFY